MFNGIGDLRDGLILYIMIVMSVCIHEWAHAFAADKIGDDTPAAQGRVTLNPIAHMDLWGTVIFPLVCIFLLPGGFFLGWGKPVLVNPRNFRHPVRDDLLITLAGPASNLVLAFLAALIGGFACRYLDQNLSVLVSQFLWINVMLAVFNMIPVPPLDGSHVLRHAVGMSEETYFKFSRWGFLVLILCLQLQPVRFALSFAIGLVGTPFVLLFNRLAG